MAYNNSVYIDEAIHPKKIGIFVLKQQGIAGFSDFLTDRLTLELYNSGTMKA